MRDWEVIEAIEGEIKSGVYWTYHSIFPKLWIPHRAAVRIVNALNTKKYNDMAVEDSHEVEFTPFLLKC